MVYLYPTKAYIENVIKLLCGESVSIFVEGIKVGWEPVFWNNESNLPKGPDIFFTTLNTVYNRGRIPTEAYQKIRRKFKSDNMGLVDYVTYGILFKLRFKGVLAPQILPPYWDEGINRLVIEIPVPSGETVNINAIELYKIETTDVPLFFVSVPLIPISVGIIADWDLELNHIVIGATEQIGP